MKDTRARIERLHADAAQCEMTANLTTLRAKRDAFQRLAVDYRGMAAKLDDLLKSGNLPST
jgi:hypothetical protein